MESILQHKGFQALLLIAGLVIGVLAAYRWLKPETPEAPPNSNLIAKIGDVPITKLEFEARYNEKRSMLFLKTGKVSGVNEEQLRLVVFQQMRNDKLLENIAKEEGIEVAKKDIDASLEDTRKLCRKLSEKTDYKDDVCLNQFAQMAGYSTLEDFIKNLRYKLYEKKLSEHFFPKIEVSEEELEKRIPSIKISQIYMPVSTEQGAAGQLRKVEAFAKSIHQKLKAGAGFEEMAMKYSIEPTGLKGGDLGWVMKSDMLPEWWEQAIKLKKGEISQPFLTRWGWHILKCSDRMDPGDEKHQKMEKFIRKMMELVTRQQKFSNLMTQKLIQLEKEKRVELYDNLLNASTYNWTGEKTKALEHYDKALKEFPNNPFIDIRMAEIYFIQREIEKSDMHYLFATQKAPSNPEVFFAICVAKLAQGMPLDSDFRYCDRASELAKFDYEMHQKLQAMYFQMGAFDKSEKEQSLAVEAYENRKKTASIQQPFLYSAAQMKQLQETMDNLQKGFKDLYKGKSDAPLNQYQPKEILPGEGGSESPFEPEEPLPAPLGK